MLEKGSAIGAHILSGNCFNTSALTELIPGWKDDPDCPLKTKVTEDQFTILFEKFGFNVPNIFLPRSIKNHGNYVCGLGEVVEWLGQKAEEAGVDVLPGFAGSELFYNEDGSVGGVITNDFGVAKDGSHKDTYTPGIIVKGKQLVLSEGCRGSLSQKVINQYELDKNVVNKQQYGIGLKEVWEVDNKHFKAGLVKHTVNWPVGMKDYSGTFMYHVKPNHIHVGMVVGLDYKDPYLNPYEEFQKFKTHPDIRKYLEGGECIAYGARALNEGGYHSVPKLTFKGGMLTGCSAGFLNVAEIKGTHHAMKSGMLAAETIFKSIEKDEDISGKELTEYEDAVQKSSIISNLKQWRNFKLGFKKNLWIGLLHGFIVQFTQGKEPWTLKTTKRDHEYTEKKDKYKPREYPKKDGKLTFDLLSNLQKSGTDHDHDQPSHLKIKDGMEEWVSKSLEEYAAPEDRFCPAKVYEHIKNEETGEIKLQINAQNCVHCKTCDIKPPANYIRWTVPEGGGGPKYPGM